MTIIFNDEFFIFPADCIINCYISDGTDKKTSDWSVSIRVFDGDKIDEDFFVKSDLSHKNAEELYDLICSKLMSSENLNILDLQGI